MGGVERGGAAQIYFGVETELWLRLPQLTPASPSRDLTSYFNRASSLSYHFSDDHLKDFADAIALHYNDRARPLVTKALSFVGRNQLPSNRYEYWFFEEDASITIDYPPPWGIELVSPILRACNWRDVVNPMWSFLESSYKIENNPFCGTHVHVSKADSQYTTTEIKRIAQSAIWWEPAWEGILPDERRGNPWSESLYVNNPFFARMNHSRMDSIRMIEHVSDTSDVLILVQNPANKYFGINFNNLGSECQTIEFRRGSCCQSRNDVFMWTSVAASFILSAMRCTSYEDFTSQEPTVRALERFMLRGAAGFHAHDIMRLFNRKRHLPTKRPLVFNWEKLDERSKENITRLTADDVGKVEHWGPFRGRLARSLPSTPDSRKKNAELRSEWAMVLENGRFTGGEYVPHFRGQGVPRIR